ncbi:hypothetical protein F5877DRAFT_81537 [Lentinula edodes]|nr:hypothetical protein F5877DRAFT_81537 [Lentinula edodes]
MFLRVLSVFKALRAFIFAICMTLSIGCATILSIFLLRQWSDFDLVSRIIVVILTVVHSLGGILLYLMIVVQFKVWLDAARVSVYLAFVLCGGLLLITGRASLPCSGSGIGNTCSQSTLSVAIASFVSSGLLLIYSVTLAVIAHIIPRPLFAKAPSDINEEGLTTVNSRTSLITSADKLEARSFSKYDYHSNHTPVDGHVHGLSRHHAPQPLAITPPSGRKTLPPVFNYTITSSPTTTSSLSTPTSSGMSYYKAPTIQHPYALSEPFYSRNSSPTTSAYSSQPSSPFFRNATPDSSPIGYPQRPSMVPSRRFDPGQISRSNDAVGYAVRPQSLNSQLTRSASAQSAPPSMASSQIQAPLDLLPNPFQDPVSRTTTPSTISSGTRVPAGSPNVSLSFGSRGFPLPPSYNITSWSQHTNEYLKSYTSNQVQTPPSTPRSLMPGLPVEAKRSSPPVVVPQRPLSFGSIAASLHSTGLPSPPTAAARLLPHPRLEAHLELGLSKQILDQSRGVALKPVGTTPTSAKTFRSQLLPTDIPEWLASEHSKNYA